MQWIHWIHLQPRPGAVSMYAAMHAPTPTLPTAEMENSAMKKPRLLIV
jgi:hypothetical protein